MAKIENNITAKKSGTFDSIKSVVEMLNTIDLSELTTDNIEDSLTSVIGVIAKHFNADHGYIILKGHGEQGATVVNTHLDGLDSALVTSSYAVIDSVMESGESIFVPDAMKSEKFQGDPCFQRFNITKVLCSSININDSVSGVIYLDSNKNDCQWEEPHQTVLDLTGTYLGMAVQNISLLSASQENRRLVAAGKATLQLSHSVKNILQMVGGAAEVIDFGLRSNEIHRVKKSWDILKPNIERLKKFTLDMLDYSKERKLEVDNCDFNRVIQGGAFNNTMP